MRMRSCVADMVAATSEGLISILSTDRSAFMSTTLVIAFDSSYTHTHTSVNTTCSCTHTYQ